MEDAYDDMRILLCLKENVSMKRFLHDFQPWMVKELRAGNLFARNVRSYEALITKNESYDVTPMYRRNLAMAAFFLINLCLGVIGTFWLQTRTRREEVGVMLSFGGTPGYIVRLLMGEGAVLTFVAALTGCLLYLFQLCFSHFGRAFFLFQPFYVLFVVIYGIVKPIDVII